MKDKDISGFLMSKANKNNDASIVRNVNLKAGMAAWLSQKRDTYPFGIETLKRRKIVSFKKSVIFSSIPFVSMAPSIKAIEGFFADKSAPEMKKPPNDTLPMNHAAMTVMATGLSQETPVGPKTLLVTYMNMKVMKKTLAGGYSGGKKKPTKVPAKSECATFILIFVLSKKPFNWLKAVPKTAQAIIASERQLPVIASAAICGKRAAQYRKVLREVDLVKSVNGAVDTLLYILLVL